MHLAEELALVAIDPDSGRHALGLRSQLNACLAGLLVAELMLDGVIEPADKTDRVVATGKAVPTAPILAAATAVVIEAGPKLKGILSHMDRGLNQRLGAGTWDATVGGLVEAGVLAAPGGRLRSHHKALSPGGRQLIVDELRIAADSDSALDPRTALLLSMTGPANLLEVVAPTRAIRNHARERIDHALDNTALQPIGKMVRKLISEAVTAAAAGSVAAMG